VFIKLWSAGSALVVLLDWTLVQKKDRKNKINVNCVSHTIVENLKQSLEITYNKRLSLSLPGLTFYEIYYPTYSRGIFCCKNMFWTLFMAGLMSLIIPGNIHLLFLCHERNFMKFMTLYSVLAYPLWQWKGIAVLLDCNCSYYD
jgi:hypothetical protein